MDKVSLDPNAYRGIDLFPDISEEIDRRIQHSEQRIKTWVLGGIAANLLVAILAAIPTIFYMGQASRDISETQRQVTILVTQIEQMNDKVEENSIWRARMEERLLTEERRNRK